MPLKNKYFFLLNPSFDEIVLIFFSMKKIHLIYTSKKASHKTRTIRSFNHDRREGNIYELRSNTTPVTPTFKVMISTLNKSEKELFFSIQKDLRSLPLPFITHY